VSSIIPRSALEKKSKDNKDESSNAGDILSVSTMSPESAALFGAVTGGTLVALGVLLGGRKTTGI
jgi:hypothetical protein